MIDWPEGNPPNNDNSGGMKYVGVIDFGSLGYAINIYGNLRAFGIDIRYEY